ncbi:cation diffusion facilitator family transporter [Sneathiella limimaris]|uniref:cation diffusion facilitator family transporter n=1 Tax=Sneathiella limimaris TaxID=1964213 RepID=UPI00146C3D94|nr:cation diffusion facilitator family transporter [Sneathiella limimaris]
MTAGDDLNHSHAHGHAHDHSHGHGHVQGQGHGHSHHHVPDVTEDSEKRVFWVMLLTGGYMILQVLGGLFAGSLALIADSGHMLSDTAALGLAWFGFRLAKKPADDKRTYGYHRFQILAAFTNGLTLFFIAGWIVIEAIDRLINPGDVLSLPMLFVAIAGLLVNIIGFVILHKGDSHNVNMQGALLHVLGDLLGSVAAIVAALIIMFTGWVAADPILSVVVAVIILKSGYGIVRKTGHILLEGTPEHLDLGEIKDDLTREFPEVLDAHHLHAWSLTAERVLLTVHVRISKETNIESLLPRINSFLKDEYEVGHATVQFEYEVCC